MSIFKSTVLAALAATSLVACIPQDEAPDALKKRDPAGRAGSDQAARRSRAHGRSARRVVRRHAQRHAHVQRRRRLGARPDPHDRPVPGDDGRAVTRTPGARGATRSTRPSTSSTSRRSATARTSTSCRVAARRSRCVVRGRDRRQGRSAPGRPQGQRRVPARLRRWQARQSDRLRTPSARGSVDVELRPRGAPPRPPASCRPTTMASR